MKTEIITNIIIISAVILLTPPLGFLFELYIYKKNKRLNPELFTVRWSRIFFWFVAVLGCIPFAGIVVSAVTLDFISILLVAALCLPLLVFAVISCYYFLRKRIVVDIEKQLLTYYPFFRKRIVISFESIRKIDRNQGGLSLFIKNDNKKVFSIGWEYIGYDLLMDTLKKHKHIQFIYKEIVHGKSFYSVKLNILNGQCMYDRFQKSELLKGETVIPFNEAMCVGEVTEEIFSHEFFLKRCAAHNVSFENYKEKVIDNLSPLLESKFSDIRLWFDSDMFCQINLLTILAYLEQSGFKGNVIFVLVNEKFETISEKRIVLGAYYETYKNVLINKVMPADTLPLVLKTGVKLYLNLCEEDNEIIKYIKKHKDIVGRDNLGAPRLISDLMRVFPQYGLGDVQYLELIKQSRL